MRLLTKTPFNESVLDILKIPAGIETPAAAGLPAFWLMQGVRSDNLSLILDGCRADSNDWGQAHVTPGYQVANRLMLKAGYEAIWLEGVALRLGKSRKRI